MVGRVVVVQEQGSICLLRVRWGWCGGVKQGWWIRLLLTEEKYRQGADKFEGGCKSHCPGHLKRGVCLQISVIDRVDEHYRDTDFGQGYEEMGFEIKEVGVRACLC